MYRPQSLLPLLLGGHKRPPAKERESALEAIIEYALNETEPEKLSPIANAVFLLIKPTLDKARQKAISGKAGGEKTASKR